MSKTKITEGIISLNALLYPHIPELSTYVFGYPYPSNPRTDAGKLLTVDMFINNGLCHVYAYLVQEYLGRKNISVAVVGSPTHVFVEYGDLYFDSANPKGAVELTRYPADDLIDYDNVSTLHKNFYNIGEALSLFLDITALREIPQYQEWHSILLSVISRIQQ